MNKLKKIAKWLSMTLVVFYVIICTGMYFIQESILFHPKKLDANYAFNFKQKFEEFNIPAEDGKKINGLLLKCDSAKGLVFYLHGNAGALDTWGEIGEKYAAVHYDIFILDYRGFGKSEGEISSEAQFYSDIQLAYNEMKKRYNEKNIVVVGYSIGTGPAAMIAANNNPKLLVLQAPYYCMPDMMHNSYPFIPDFLLKYKLKTHDFVARAKAPVLVFHGTNDKIIYYGSSLKLKEHFKPGDKLITLEGEGHSRLGNNLQVISEMKKALAN
ncbi:MAG: alpha/beta hydrolase [Bacteroidia bacterium]